MIPDGLLIKNPTVPKNSHFISLHLHVQFAEPHYQYLPNQYILYIFLSKNVKFCVSEHQVHFFADLNRYKTVVCPYVDTATSTNKLFQCSRFRKSCPWLYSHRICER